MDFSWQTPEPDWTKINCDGALIKATGDAGIGVVVQNEKGALIGGTGRILLAATIEETEALAKRRPGFNRKDEASKDHYIIETDSQEVFKAVNKRNHKCFWCILPIVKEIRAKVNNFEKVKFLGFVEKLIQRLIG
ncbi:hypothetical protein COLO4_28862 [Corchorus olitorius]|uniref:RNase H type-1 domain-containing protein n=1 Tax=Corchorus olitorius TaxID=93759 RepID=A0A1R3HHX0_9ROSI|nr:hypothetical protein COLO4_28862 [Corchorus olitorius]